MSILTEVQRIDWGLRAEEPCGLVVRHVRETYFERETPFCCGLDGKYNARALIGNAIDQFPWKQTHSPSPGAVVLAGLRPNSPTHHCGVYLEAGVVHWFEPPGAAPYVTMTLHPAFSRLFRLVEYWELTC